MAAIAPEVGCVEIVLHRGGETRWRDTLRDDSNDGGETMEMVIGDSATLLLTFGAGATLDTERRELLEELGVEIGERLTELGEGDQDRTSEG